jgi:hypothetical protein
MVLDEVAGGDVEFLTVPLYLQDGILHVAQQLLVLQQERQGRLSEAAGPTPGCP